MINWQFVTVVLTALGLLIGHVFYISELRQDIEINRVEISVLEGRLDRQIMALEARVDRQSAYILSIPHVPHPGAP